MSNLIGYESPKIADVHEQSMWRIAVGRKYGQ
jgi:hypothetical protein